MRFEKTLTVLNEMQAAGVIGHYAIGGAVAAFLYIEPGITYDIDTFISWELGPSGLLTLGPIYSYLLERGYVPQQEVVMIEGWAVQFLPASTDLVKDALGNARAVEMGTVMTHAFTLEYLMAICLETGRPKDTARLVQFVQESTYDKDRFASIIERYGLSQKWTKFNERFFDAP